MSARHALRCRAASAAVVALLAGLALEAAPAGAIAPTISSISATPSSPRAGDSVKFSASVSPGTAGDTISVAWNFAGPTATGNPASHTFTAPGSYTVTAVATNQLNEPSAPASKTITVVPNKPPVASFKVTPAIPNAGERAVFTSTSSDPDGSIVSQAWDFNDDGTTDSTAKNPARTFNKPGIYTIHLTVTDDLGASDTVTAFVTVNALPVATIDFTPGKPIAQDEITFTSKSRDPDGTIASQAWDLDHDGLFDDGTATTAKKTFDPAGSYIVGLEVTDDRGAVTSTTVTVAVVPNQPPSASFTYAPTGPQAGTQVTFNSSARDPDGTVSAQTWDLDGDGVFDDARGPTVRKTFAASGTFDVSLRVTDNKGAIDTATQHIAVAEAPKAPSGQFASTGSTPVALAPQAGKRALPALLSPFPIVTLRGRLIRGGARIDGLEITQVPKGARVEVRCRGRGCPFRSKARRARGRTVRFPELSRRRLRSGVVLKVIVTQSGHTGKYTSFRIRKVGAPARKDLCMLPRARKPRRCQTA